jgi:6-pyruvoyltetrahydropterin/6-carboxytetrahydropterin synthase
MNYHREAYITKRYSVPALHTLSSEELSAEENLRVFGPCSRLHGHEYLVEITVSGPVDCQSGMLISRDELDEIVHHNLVRPLSGSNLSDRFSHTTGEALAQEFFDLLNPFFGDPVHLSRVRVQETAKNSFFVDAPAS